MKAGRFRSDLYYRINVVVMRVPPLRERREDIMVLALFFLDHFNRKFGKNVGPYAPDAITALETADWPGNVRELQHAVERAVVTNVAGPIHAADFGTLNGSGGFQAAASVDQLLPFREARERFEREYFAKLLHSAGGNVSEAARLSGIARQNFYGHIERLGIVTKS